MEPDIKLVVGAPPDLTQRPRVTNWLPLRLRRCLQEPLLHFLLIGAALFVVYGVFNHSPDNRRDRRIVLTENDLSQMTIATLAQGRSAPTIEQMQNLLEAKIREEVLYREALAMGLDKDDVIVKRRMLQKMDFLAEDLSDLREPDREELEAWFNKNAQRFTYPPRVTFRHLYFSFDRHGLKTEEVAAVALRQVTGQPADSSKAAALADPFMFRDYYADRSPDQVASEFGKKFEQSVFELKPGSWQGPVESGFGWHLVFVESLTPSRTPGFAEIEPAVKSEWIKDERSEFKRKAYEVMKARYEIVLPTEQAIEAACSGNPKKGPTAESTPAGEIQSTGAPAWLGGL
ncbi:MAG: peptidyl-prolyl cis-trans isomerase [Verrucomicrobia bacterium]|nr:peptidyl-prolyl cis-trans isomerase [Verrucomicrobiota bacterium]